MNSENKEKKEIETLDIYEPDEVDAEIDDLFIELTGDADIKGNGSVNGDAPSENKTATGESEGSDTTPSKNPNSSADKSGSEDTLKDDTGSKKSPSDDSDNGDINKSNNNVGSNDNLPSNNNVNNNQNNNNNNNNNSDTNKKDKTEEKNKNSSNNQNNNSQNSNMSSSNSDKKNENDKKDNTSNKGNNQNVNNSNNTQKLTNDNSNSSLKKNDNTNNVNNNADNKNNLLNRPEDKKSSNRGRNSGKASSSKTNNRPRNKDQRPPRTNKNRGGLSNPKTPKTSAIKNKVKETSKAVVEVIKAFIKAHPVAAGIIIGVILLGIILGITILALASDITPSAGNDIKENESAFSDNDLKIIEGIQNKTSANSRPNAELALAAVVYPYFPSLYSGNVTSLLNKISENDLTDDEKAKYDEYKKEDNKQEILESFGCDEFCQELLGEDGTDEIIKAYAKDSDGSSWKTDESGQEYGVSVDTELANDDDPYLFIFRNNKYLKNYETLLQQLSSSTEAGDYESEEGFFSYLFDTYSKKDVGYKALFSQTNNETALKEAIKEDIISHADMFLNYLKENNCTTDYNYQSAGQITLTDVRNEISLQDVLTKNLVFDVKEPCVSSGAKSIVSCKSYYDSYISMEQYLIGVTVQESESTDVEDLAANMVAEKSDIIQKAYRRGDVAKVDDSTYVVRVKDSTGDQRYCDYETLAHCSSGKSKLTDKQLSIFKEAFEKSKNDYIWNGKDFLGSVCQTQRGCDCGKYVCFGQDEAHNYAKSGEDYKQILLHEYSSVKDASILTVDGNYLSSSIGTATTNCPSDYSNSNGLGIPDDQFIFLYQDHNTTGFCGSGCSIASSGCGGTTYAMLVANLSDQNNFTPNDASRDGTGSNHCGCGGSDDGLFTNVLVNKHSGFTTKTLPRTLEGAQEVIETIRNGGLVAVNVQGPHSEFTTGGHWMLIRGLTEDGKVKVANPNKHTAEVKHPGQNQKGFNVEDFINNNYLIGSDGRKHNWIAIYGPKSEQIKMANQSALDTENADVEGATKNKYFAPIQNLKPTFKSVSSTPGCSNSVSHDISGLSEGTKLYAGMDGTAEFKQTYCGSQLVSYGNRVQITGSDGTYIIYGHLKDFPSSIKPKITKTCPKKGSTPPCPASSCSSTTTTIATVQVKKGDYIGTLGNTGNSTGPHLHVEIHEGGGKSCVVDPWSAFGMR